MSSSYISPNEGSKVMNIIIDSEKTVIDIDSLGSLTGELYYDLKPVLKRLVRNEQLSRIEKGLYCIRNFRNPYVIANALHKESVIGYWSALNLYLFLNLITTRYPELKMEA